MKAAKSKNVKRKVAPGGTSATSETSINTVDSTDYFISVIGNFFDRFSCFIAPILATIAAFVLGGGLHHG